MKRQILLLGLVLMVCRGWAAEWQWSVPIPGIVSDETGGHPRAFLYIPDDCHRVKAVMVGNHNMCEETLFENVSFRRSIRGMGLALVWVTPGWDQVWNADKGTPEAYWRMLEDLAEVSGYAELAYAPVVPFGHSAMATFPWNFAAWHPERTLAVVSYHGDAPRTNLTGYGRENIEWGRTRNIDGIPGLMVEGEYEWWEARVNPALAFRMMYPESCISFLCDAGRGHFDVSDRTAEYIALFVKKAMQARLPEDASEGHVQELKKVRPEDGWLAERWHPVQPRRAKAAPFAEYRGDVHDAFWYFDREMAELTEARYAEERGKELLYLGVEQQGRLVGYDAERHVKANPRFIPEADGLTFRLRPVFTDSLRRKVVRPDVKGHPYVERICGPVKVVDDTTFKVDFYRMGTGNVKRTAEMCLVACYDGDDRHKSVVQELTIRIPYPLKEGKRQCLLFPGLEDVGEGTDVVSLKAVSDCGLPVSYYVKEGPAEVEGSALRLTRIPPRAKFPVKVTVVAWQYGLPGQVQTAEPVERSFYVLRR
ncbi:hypothetical protein [Paraprevotella xylaniphila]|uniref:hypothetical protein n=1 Tax=Paraprevotella xylaniphila TaxID=454155 RepID=UPI002666D1E2|nr:hypothetical protein [Paraprevotella xylaniphila]